jgi:hypothetical protein
LYALHIPSSSHQVFHAAVSSPDTWHLKLVHCSPSIISALYRNKSITTSSLQFNPCIDCNKTKAHKLPFTLSQNHATQPLQVVHTDLWGPASELSHNGHRYYVHFIDEYTRFSWLYTCASKTDVLSIFTDFKLKVENQLSCSIKCIQYDEGFEFRPLQSKFPAIIFQISCPHTLEQNGLAERKHRHLVELSLATMFHDNIPLVYWDWIFSSVNFVINHLLIQHTTLISPFEKLFQQKPDYSFLKTIGCACYPLLRPYNSNKLQPRADQCVIMGYCQLHKEYKCLHVPTQRVYISRHVLFHEHLFLFKISSSSSSFLSDPQPSQSLTILPPVQPLPFLLSNPHNQHLPPLLHHLLLLLILII